MYCIFKYLVSFENNYEIKYLSIPAIELLRFVKLTQSQNMLVSAIKGVGNLSPSFKHLLLRQYCPKTPR